MIEDYLYIIDPESFSGSGTIQNTMSKESGLVHYMDKETTLEEYKQHKGNSSLIALSWEEFSEKYYQPYLDSLTTDWSEITAEEWDDMLNVLPPVRWTHITGGSFFFISEATTAYLHGCFLKYKGKHFTRLSSIHDKTSQIIESLPKVEHS